MYHTVVELGQLSLVPTVGCTHQITCDTLQAVYIVAAAFRTGIHILLGILITAVLSIFFSAFS